MGYGKSLTAAQWRLGDVMEASITLLSFLLFSMCQSIQIAVKLQFFNTNISKTVGYRASVTMWHIRNRLVTWSMASRDLERSRLWPKRVRAHYLENGWRYRLGYNGTPIGNAICGIKWSHARWRHVTLKGQGRDSDIFGAEYLENAWR